MKPRSDIDPELHTLKSVARSLDGRERSECETARFQIYAAFEQRDPDSAKRWCSALRVALLVLPHETDDQRAVRAAALGALDTIDRSIG